MIDEIEDLGMEDIAISPLIKDIVEDCLKDIDYNSNQIETNSWKGIVMYMVDKVARYNNKRPATTKEEHAAK